MPLRRHYICSSLALVFATWLGACSDDGDDSEGFDGSDSACVPDTFRGTCLEEFFLEYGSCLSSRCLHLVGARQRIEGRVGQWCALRGHGRTIGSQGDAELQLRRTYLHCFDAARDRCLHRCARRDQRHVDEICVEPGSATKDRRSIYRCKNGREYHVSEEEAHVDAGACPAATDLSKCVDANGVLLSNRM